MTDSSVEAVARALRNHEDSYYDRVQGLHYFSERALAALPSPEREPLREALELLVEACEPRRVENFDPADRVTIIETRTKDIIAFHEALDNACQALAPPTAQSGDRT